MNDSIARPFPATARCLFAAALCSAAPLAAAAQAPAFRVADVNTQPVVRSSTPRQFHAAGDLTFFVADGDTGTAVWRTDGSAEGTVRLFALATGALQHAAAIDGGYLLVVDHMTHRALVHSDGTAGGTQSLTTLSNLPNWRTPEAYATHGGALFFVAGDSATGEELWRSDGTAAGTRLVLDVRPGTSGSEIRFVGSAGGALLFSAEDGEINGPRLWRTDGTFAGTRRVNRTYVTPGARSAELDGIVYFVGTIGSRFDRPELWRSDGTPAGTFSVSPGLSVRSLLAVGDALFLAAAEQLGASGLWRSDGTAAGIALVAEWDAGPASDLDLLADARGTLLFRRAAEDGYALWRSDGTAEGTEPVATLPTPAACTGAAAHDGAFWLVIDDVLWRSDGTTVGTAPLAPVVASRDTYRACTWPLFAGARGGVLFARDGGEGVELWHSDGTAAGTAPLANLADDTRTAGSDPEQLNVVGDALYFTADDGAHGRELWRSDGSASGTRLVADLRPGSASAFGRTIGNYVHPFLGDRRWVAAGDRIYFVADDGAGGAVWRSDGTAAGTVRLTASGAAAPRNLIMVAGVLFFLAHDADGGVVLWRSDGTAAGTGPLRALASRADALSVGHLVDMAGELFFAVGTALWRSDGSAEGTGPVRDLADAITQVAARGDRLYVGASGRDANDMRDVTDVWRSDGSADGTTLIAGLEDASALAHVASIQDVAFFVTRRRVWGWSQFQDALWISDGTAAGSRRVAELIGAAYYGNDSWHPPVTLADHLYVLGDSSSGRVALLRADSTGHAAPLATFAAANAMVGANGHLLFGACEHADQCGIWESDGSPAGTRLVARAGDGLVNRPGEWLDRQIAVGGELAYFAHADTTAGRELWALPLSALGRCAGAATCGECAGDCDGDAVVDIAELLAMVRAMLDGTAPPCQVGDADRSGGITVDEAVAAIGRALDGCE